MGMIAYCPLAQAGKLKRMGKDYISDETLNKIAEKHGASVFRIMLAFAIQFAGKGFPVSAIPKASSPEHVRENAAAADVSLDEDDLAEIDAAFWPPASKMHLDIE